MLNLLVIVAAEIVGTLVASAPRTEDFSITQPGRTLTARVDASGLSGPMLQLGRAPGELRGRIRNFPTELRFSADRVSGLVGRAPVDLHITRSDEGLRVQGLFAGKLSNLRINSAELKGTLGQCSYAMHVEETSYQGERSCGGLPVPVTVRIPQRLTERPVGEFVASLVALLGQG